MSEAPLILNVPFMHPDLNSSITPEEVAFFDPGLCSSTYSWKTFRPVTLPLDAKELKSRLDQLNSFGMEAGGQANLAYFKLTGAEDLYSESSFDLAEELAQKDGKIKQVSKQEMPLNLFIKFQLILALAFEMEETKLSLETETKLYKDKLIALKENISGNEEGLQSLPQSDINDLERLVPDISYNFQQIFVALLFFAPLEANFWLADSQIIEELQENYFISERSGSDIPLPFAPAASSLEPKNVAFAIQASVKDLFEALNEEKYFKLFPGPADILERKRIFYGCQVI